MGKWTRRGFITAGVVGGGALVVGVALRMGNRNEELAPLVAGDGEQLVNAWVKIDTDNTVTAIIPHCEMGQGAHTALAQMLADELDARWEDVGFLEAPAADEYANWTLVKGFALGDMKLPKVLAGSVDGLFFQVAKAMNMQITGGSLSVRATGVAGMRVAGAAAAPARATPMAPTIPAICPEPASAAEPSTGQREHPAEPDAPAAILDQEQAPPSSSEAPSERLDAVWIRSRILGSLLSLS